MNYCSECFYDEEIIAIVKGQKIKGNCDICGRENVNICNITNEAIHTYFKSLIDVYTQTNDSINPENRYLKNVLLDRWNIFNLTPDQVQTFLISLFPDEYKTNRNLFEKPVAVDSIIFEKFSMFGIYSWDDFGNGIKDVNRFHTKIIKLDFLRKIINFHTIIIPKDTILYRGRLNTDGKVYTKTSMGFPPKRKARAGRINPNGISCLYLSDTVETTFYEIRAGINDKASIANFILEKESTIIDLTKIDAINPFSWDNYEDAIAELAANINHLKRIATEIGRPLSKSDSPLDYIPIQYICDYIKSEDFDGIKYKSTLNEGGINYAFFDEKLFKCIKVEAYEISSLKYKYNKIIKI